jgi:chorismate mutase
MTLDKLRSRIDSIDELILDLLAERFEIGLLTRRLKTGIVDSGREAAVIDGIRRNSHGLLKPDFAAELYARIIAESRAIQAEDRPILAYLGARGSEVEAAARRLEPSAALVPCSTVAQLEDLVSSGLVDRALPP